MQKQLENMRRRLGAVPKIVWIGAVGLAVAVAAIALLTLDIVTVADSRGERRVVLTGEEDAYAIVQMVGLSLADDDTVEYIRTSPSAAEVFIERAFEVDVHVDGGTLSTRIASGTVADALQQAGVSLSGEDYVEPPLEESLQEGDAVVVYRVTYVDEVREQELTPEQIEQLLQQLPQELHFTQSYNNLYDVTYRDTLVDGLVVESEVAQVVPRITPRPQDSYLITPGVPTSRIIGFDDIEMGPDGRPLDYEYIMQNAICTAYSSSGGMGSSGLGLYCGTVAVNPNVIPYGTRMYITAADNSFVYGFAIATDTGIALMEGIIDLDLYFETNDECLVFGKKELMVYILPTAEE